MTVPAWVAADSTLAVGLIGSAPGFPRRPLPGLLPCRSMGRLQTSGSGLFSGERENMPVCARLTSLIGRGVEKWMYHLLVLNPVPGEGNKVFFLGQEREVYLVAKMKGAHDLHSWIIFTELRPKWRLHCPFSGTCSYCLPWAWGEEACVWSRIEDQKLSKRARAGSELTNYMGRLGFTNSPTVA